MAYLDQFTEQESKQQLIDAGRLYVQMRWFWVSTLVVTGVLARIFTAKGMGNVNFSPMTMIGIMVFFFALNSVYFWFYRRASHYSYAAVVGVTVLQIVFEILGVIVIIFFAGGIIAIGFLFLTYSIVASGLFYSYRGVFTVTTFASVCYGGLIWGQYFDLIPYLSRYNNAFEYQLAHNLAAVVPNTFTIILTFYFISWFVSKYSRSIALKEKEVRQEHDKESALIAGLADGLIYLDQKGVIDFVNPAAETLLSLEAKNIIGKPLSGGLLDDYPVLSQIFKLDFKPENEFVLLNQPDTHVQVTSVDIKDLAKKTIGQAKIIHDVSRERFMEKMKSEFITIAGHQLRTPLSAIKNALCMLRDGDYGKVSDEQRLVIGQSYDYTERMIQLVNDLLNVSEVEEGRFDFSFKPVDLFAVLKEVVERFQMAAEHKHITIKVVLKNDAVPILADVFKLKLAIGCIIDNAITYTPAGGWVTVECDFSDKQSVLIRITDTGIGIDVADQTKMFTKFFRASNALKFNTEGNGLDLFIAKNIILRHKGRIWLESEIDEGTTFNIELPV